MEIVSKYVKEKYLFWLVVLISLIPLFQGPFLPTLDGAAHLYNSNIILEKLYGNELMNEFFYVNSEWVPNWSGHFILAFFNSFLPGHIAEKIFLLIYFIGLPLSFRYFLKNLDPKGNAYLMSYFILPFCYSFPMLMGFYNFSMAILFFFLSGSFWLKHKEEMSIKNTILLSLLLFTTYFSHLVVFGLLMFSLGLHSLWNHCFKAICDQKSFLNFIKGFWSEIWKLLIAGAIPLILATIYFFSRSDDSNVNYLEFRELVDWLKELRPLIMYHEETEGAQTKKLVYLFGMLMTISLFLKFNQIQIDKTENLKKQFISFVKELIRPADVWLLLSLIVLYLYFKLPDGAQGAGFISIRLAYIFFLILIIWIALQKLPRWFLGFSIVCVLYLNLKLNDYYKTVAADMNIAAVDVQKISRNIEDNSVVLPINRSANWLQGHFSNYLGIDKPMVILENYEATTNYFPVRWNYNGMPRSIIPNYPLVDFSCVWWPENFTNAERPIEYIFILGRLNPNTSCDSLIQLALDDQFNLVGQNKHCLLYKLKE